MFVQQFYKPPPALQELVNNIMVAHAITDPPAPLPIVPAPPLPENCLFFYPYDQLQSQFTQSDEFVLVPRNTFLGAQYGRVNIRYGYNQLVIKVAFEPGGLHRLLRIPMDEMVTNKEFNSCEFFGRDIAFVTEQLAEAATYVEMVTIVETFLLKKIHLLKQRLPIDGALPHIIKQGGLINIDKVASLACLSTRQLERVFQERIGLTPKFFARVVRFVKAWTIRENDPKISWTKIAYECGYFDQMHLIKDFKEFTGTTPTIIDEEFSRTSMRLNNKLFY
jgi:AraC-like DNA-binding protein